MIDDSIETGFVEIDDHEVKDFLEALGEKKTQNLFRVQMKASARILQKKTIQNFMQKYNYQGVWKQEIIRKSGPYQAEEGCLSLTGARPARRWKSIKVRWQNEKFQERIKTFTGWTAQIIQHEIDHCEGVII